MSHACRSTPFSLAVSIRLRSDAAIKVAAAFRTVVPCGVSTNVCVESTLRDAFEHSYYVCVPQDGCASWDMELHTATLKTASARFGLVLSTEEIAAVWQDSGAKRAAVAR